MRCWRVQLAFARASRYLLARYHPELSRGLQPARSAAVGMQALGLRKGDRVCLLMLNRRVHLCWMAASMLGLVLSPMNPSYKEREVAYQLQNSEAKAILVQRETAAAGAGGAQPGARTEYVMVTGSEPVADDPQAIPFGLLLMTNAPTQAPLVEVRGDDLIALPYSSGTTGLPKGVMLTHRNLVINFHQFISASRVTEQDVFMVFLPLYHIYGVALMGQATFSGSALVMVERFDPGSTLAHQEARGHDLPGRAAGVVGAVWHAQSEPRLLPERRHILSPPRRWSLPRPRG